MDAFQFAVVGVFTFGSACWLLYEFWCNVQERAATIEAAAEMPVPQWMRKVDLEAREIQSESTPTQGESAPRPYSSEPVPIFRRRELVGSASRMRRSA